MKTKIAIAGAGWLGKHLAIFLRNLGHQVSVISRDCRHIEWTQNMNIALLVTDYSNAFSAVVSANSDVLIICIPPVENYTDKIDFLVRQTEAKKIIFCSSTSVYKQEYGLVDEESEVDGNPSLIAAEALLESYKIPCFILRLGGLIGLTRHPSRSFAGKLQLPNGKAPVNLIHQEDVIEIIGLLILKSDGGIFNLVNPAHPMRKSYYENNCSKQGLAPCQFANQGKGKIVRGDKIACFLSRPYAYSIY